jgi:hypothetical protein
MIFYFDIEFIKTPYQILKLLQCVREVNKSGNYLVKQYKECYSRDIDIFSKQELSELEELCYWQLLDIQK